MSTTAQQRARQRSFDTTQFLPHATTNKVIHDSTAQQATSAFSANELLINANTHTAANADMANTPLVLRPQPNSRLLSRTPNLTNPSSAALREQLRAYFIESFDTYESLFECLADDQAFYQKSIRLRHPLIFYYGHTATFFVNKLLLAKLLTQRINPKYESMFAVGVDEMSWDDLDETHYDWPNPQQVKAYRDQVRAAVLEVIDHAPLNTPVNWQHPWWAIVMGIEHERIHLETSSVLIRQHDIARVQTHSAWQPHRGSGVAPTNRLLPVAAGHVQRHQNFEHAYYGWDNEFGQHEAQVDAFMAAEFLISNQEFLAFVEADGYLNPNYWTEEGQGWLHYTQAQHPTFWLKTHNAWQLRLMTEVVDMPWDWPVEVNYLEAKAFCNWKAEQTGQPIRLPTEDEWQRLHAEAGAPQVDLDQPNQASHANLHLDYAASSCPVNVFAQGDFFDVIGNVWQWTETPIYPFEGFDVHPIYDDFTTPTFDQKHNILKGGSWISCGNESLPSSRYAFRRHFFQHAGFRYISSQAAVNIPESQYETDKLMSEYAEFHYGECYFGVKNFSQALVDLAIQQLPDLNRAKALDLGCASGRASFELAQHFEQVTGIDFSARFIAQGVQLARGNTLRYALCEQGDLVQYKACHLSDLNLNLDLDTVQQRVTFVQGDACNLKTIHREFDFILAANLIDRLYDPAKFLNYVHERLNIGGVLMISSPYTWLEEHTPKQNWLGGYKKDGESFTTLDGLHALLDNHFERIGSPHDVEFVIRETKRKFQHSVAEVTFWRRKH